MSKRRFSWDRFSDDHLIQAFAVLLAIVGIGMLVLLAKSSDAAPGSWAVGYGLLAGAGFLYGLAMVTRFLEIRQRRSLNQAVDVELRGKWEPGFANLVGAYEKPWYLLCGETSVGKTAALRAANLPMATGPLGQTLTDPNQGRNGTFMFDWWFFEDAIVLDSAGDLIENPDDRWITFLQRVRDARPVQPLNGVIVAVSAADFLGDGEALKRKAELLARQVEVARSQLQVRFPVYLMITKSDLITGFIDYFPANSDLKASYQIIGWSNPRDPRIDDRPTEPEDIRQGLEKLGDELRTRRTLMLRRCFTSRDDANVRIDHLDEMFTFPRSIDGMMGNLESFMKAFLAGVGAVNPPFVRGVYFTSALRTGQALDVELQKALGMDQLPMSRRAASDRAFFVRDFFLEKVIPEAGMVTPLEDVVATTRRRGRVLIGGTVAAAILVVVATLTGYFQTAGHISPHRKLWKQLAEQDKLSDLVLYDNQGNYRGDARLGSDDVLQIHEQLARLAGNRIDSGFLPGSQEVEKNRATTGADLFRQFAFRPALDHPAPQKITDESAPRLVPLLCDLIETADGRKQPVTIDSLAQLAARCAESEPDGAKPADVARLTALLKSAPMLASSAGTTDLKNWTPSISDVGIQQLLDWVNVRHAAMNQYVRGLSTFLGQVRTLANVENTYILATNKLATFNADGTDDLQSQSKLIDQDTRAVRSNVMQAWTTKLGSAAIAGGPALGDRALAFLQVPVEFKRIDAMLESLEPTGTAAELQTALKAYRNDTSDGFKQLNQAAGNSVKNDTVPAQPEIIAELNRLDTEYLGPGKTPRIIDRFTGYQKLFSRLEEWKDVQKLYKKDPHELLQLPDTLKVVKAQYDESTREDFVNHSSTNGVEASASGGKISVDEKIVPIIATLLRDAHSSRTLHVLQVALESEFKRPDSLDVTPLKDAPVARKSSLSPFVWKIDSISASKPIRLIEWSDALASVDVNFPEPALQQRPDIRASLKTLSDNLDRCYIACCTYWTAVIDKVETPAIQTWNDLKPFDRSSPAAINDALEDSLQEPREALTTLSGIQRLSSRSNNPTSNSLARIPKRSNLVIDERLGRFLSTWNFTDSAATRISLLQLKNPGLDSYFQISTPSTPDSTERPAVTKFWENALGRSVDLLVAEAKPVVKSHMKRLYDQSDKTFPISPGNENWNAENIDPLIVDVDAIRPPGVATLSTGPAIKIRDLELVTAEWSVFIDHIRSLNTFLKNSDSRRWYVKFAKGEKGGHWIWMYVKVPELGLYSRQNPGPEGLDETSKIRGASFIEVKSGGKLLVGLEVTPKNDEKGNITDAGRIEPTLNGAWALLRQIVDHPDGKVPLKYIGLDGIAVPLDLTIDTSEYALPAEARPLQVPALPE